MTLLLNVILATTLFAGGQAAVLRDALIEITMPPGVAMPTRTSAPDAAGVDYSTETESAVYRIQYFDISKDPVEPDKLFASIRANIKQGMTLDSEETFTHQGHRGLRLYISQPNLKQVMRMDCIAVGGRLYRVWFIARTVPDLHTPAIKAFFDSFKIL